MPRINDNGEVIVEYVKKLVSKQSFKSYYAAHPSYSFLAEMDNGIVIGFTRAKKGDTLPDHLQYANPGEIDIIRGRSSE